jgi:hypothetical protein
VYREILELDPAQDTHKILYLSAGYQFPFLMLRAQEFALFRTYAVPSIGRLLHQTGHFAQAGQRRYDDTALILAEIAEHGYDSDRGRRALRRMNQIHGRYSISNEDYLYVMSAIICEPVRWCERYGWRKSSPIEIEAGYRFWAEVARRMGIRDVPPSYEAYEAFNRAYEAQHFRYTSESRAVAEATVKVFLARFPRWLHPLARQAIYALMDDPLREAFGYPPAWLPMRWAVLGGAKIYARLGRFLPGRRTVYLFTSQKNRTYPAGYELEALGPEK